MGQEGGGGKGKKGRGKEGGKADEVMKGLRNGGTGD